MLKFKRITIKDIHLLTNLTLRKEDARELRTVSGISNTWLALKSCVAQSTEWTEICMEEGGEVIMVHGLSSHGNTGIPWMVGGYGIYPHKHFLHRYSYKIIEDMHKEFKILGNIVDSRNKVHIRWLKQMGFIFDPTTNIKLRGVVFLGFYKVKED